MNDFSNELFTGTPDEIDEERRQQLLREAQSLKEEAAQIRQEAQQPTPQPAATAPVASEPTQQKPKEQEDFYGADLSFQQDDVDPSALQTVAESVLAIPASGTDFVVDLLNLAPGVDLPKIPEFENEIAQTVREVSSIVLPTVGLGGAGAAGLAGAAGKLSKASKVGKFLSDPFVKWLGNVGFQAGTGAFVDYTVEINQEDDNLAGVLKANWPQAMGWIPENVATLDSDDPDAKRAKNVLEGVYLGAATDVLTGVAKLWKRTRGFRTEIIPKTEKSGQYFERNMPEDVTIEDAVERSAAKRELVIDQVGKFNFDKSVQLNGVERALDEPIYGVTDMFGYQEYGGRSVDDYGIALAGVDSYRTRNNVASTNGRVGSIVSEGFIKRFNDGNFDTNVMLRGVKEEMLDADEFDVRLADGTYITAKQVIENGEELAAEHYMMSLPNLKKLFNELATEESGELGVRTLSSTGMEAARKMMKKYMDDFINMDAGRAEAYLETSLAGQVSDTAQGMRLVEGTPAIERAQEQILDRVQMLMAMRGRAAYVRGRALNMTNTWNRLKAPGTAAMKANQQAYAERVAKQIKEEIPETLRTLKAIELDAALSVDTLRELSKENPEMLSPLWLAYEFTDGNVDTVAKLNKFLAESTGTIRKAIIDKEPGMPSIILQGMWSNIYNSTLSAFATPIKAGISNFAGLVQKPLGNYVGAMRTGDTRLYKRGWYQYFSSLESLQNSFQYMAQVFKRSATEADVNNLVRDDLFVKNEKQIEVLQAFADAKSLQGDDGPQYMMQQVKAINDLAMHPWLRFGNRAMQALDGFTQAMIAHAEAKGRAFDEVTNFGRREFNAERAEEVYKKAYSEMFDESGLITDRAVQYTAGEIALNLDNEANNAFSNIIARAPILKPFFLFTKTPINEIRMMASYTPMGRFIKGLNDFDLPVEKLSDEEIAEKLKTRGIQLDTNDPQAYVNKYNEIRADFRGRRALGELAVLGAIGLMASDRLTGNGIYDKQKQRARRDQDWKPRSIRLPGGNWVSYDNLGPFTNWMALTADIMDNFDTLAPNDAGEQMRKMGFILSASFTDKSYLAGIEPLLGILRGDPSEIARFSSSFLSSATIRGSSQMAEISRLFDPGLKEVEQDLFNLIQNRLPGLKSTLPAQYDYIDGGEVGIPNWITRITNNYLPWKVNGKISPEKQFLIDIEYDGRPNIDSNGKGIKYTPSERSDIARIMGEDKLFKRSIQQVMNSTEGKRFRKAYMEATRLGVEVPLREFKLLHLSLDKALRKAVKFAEARIPGNDRVTRQFKVNEITSDFFKMGDTESAKEYIQYIKEQGFTY